MADGVWTFSPFGGEIASDFGAFVANLNRQNAGEIRTRPW